jgi:hypothetical protein
MVLLKPGGDVIAFPTSTSAIAYGTSEADRIPSLSLTS